jgi:hypothetical protein
MVLDDTSSLGATNFNYELQFAQAIISAINVGAGPGQSTVAATMFGSKVTPVTGFGTALSTNPAALSAAIGAQPYGAESATDIGMGLSQANTFLQSDPNQGNLAVRKVVLLVTDGR